MAAEPKVYQYTVHFTDGGHDILRTVTPIEPKTLKPALAGAHVFYAPAWLSALLRDAGRQGRALSGARDQQDRGDVMARAASSYRCGRRNVARETHALAGWHAQPHYVVPKTGERVHASRTLPGLEQAQRLRAASSAVKAGRAFLARGADKIKRAGKPNTWGSFFKLSRGKARARSA